MHVKGIKCWKCRRSHFAATLAFEGDDLMPVFKCFCGAVNGTEDANNGVGSPREAEAPYRSSVVSWFDELFGRWGRA